MAMTKFATYDDDYATLGQVKAIVTNDMTIMEGVVKTLPKTYSTQPQVPYHTGDTYTLDGKSYTCITTRTTGSFTQSDWVEAVPANKIIAYANASDETERISKTRLDADIITTINLSAQTISCNQLSGGVINGQTINGGTINGAYLSATQGSIGGWGIDGVNGIASGNSAIRPNGSLALYFTGGGGGGVYRINNGVRLNAGAGVCIGSATDGNLAMPTNKGIDIKGCSGNEVYIGCMANSDGTSQRSAVRVQDGVVRLVADGPIYANGVAIGGSSSKATKTKIKNLSKKNKNKVYNLLKNIPIKQYDYKKKYGKKHNYGFLIEDVENTELNELLHITKHDTDKNIKTYCAEDLVRLQLIAIQEVMKKVEYLENKLQELEEKLNEK